ncbi:hypothetical protein P9112_006192 [Eukaryota sp. TZLM1-RC]
MSSHFNHSCPEIDPADIELGEKIGQGGSAIVYSAKWFCLAVAIKLVFLTDEGKAKLKKEISLLSMLNSPAILRVFGVTYIDNKIGIVMELATSSLNVPSSLSNQNLAIAKELCCAMKVLHSKSVIHGDLKPQNILLVNGQIRLADFGTSKVIADHTANSTSLTFTPKYAALEVFDNRITEASDIYSIGVILYELLTNKVAFEGLNTQFSLLGAKYQGKELAFDQKVPEILKKLVNDCMSSDPSKRPTIDQIIHQLSLLENYAGELPLINEFNPNLRQNCQNCAQKDQINEDLSLENENFRKSIIDLNQRNQELTLQNSNLVSRNQELCQTLVEKDQLINDLRIEISNSNSKIDALSQKEKKLKEQITSIHQICHNNFAENQNFGNPNQLLVDDSSSNEDQEEINSSDCDQNLQGGFENLEVESDGDTLEQMVEKGLEFYNDECYQEAVFWWRRAAEAGHGYAMFNLGYCYGNGQGVEKDYQQAFHWFNKAAEAGFSVAMRNLGVCYRDGLGVEQDHQQALYWFNKAAEAGFSVAMRNLGVCYRDGLGVEQDHQQALYWFNKAAEAGDDDAMFSLGCCYRTGKGVDQDHQQAFYWFSKAAEAGNSVAMVNLGCCYRNGKGVDQDHQQAFYWFKKGADAGNTATMVVLGHCYRYGHGVEQDYSQAVFYYQKAAELGHEYGMFNLGKCYEHGYGVPKALHQAIEWYDKAKDVGHPKAAKRIESCRKELSD